MTSTAQKLPPRTTDPPHSTDENDNLKLDKENTTKDSVLSYLTKCGLASHSEISVNDIDESSLALLAGLSHRHLVFGDDADDAMETITEETAGKVAEKIQGKLRGKDHATTKVEDYEDDDDEDDDDDDDDAATDRAVIFSTTTRIKNSSSTSSAKKLSNSIEMIGSGRTGNGMIQELSQESMGPERVSSSSSFKDKDDESSVQKLYTEYTSLFGSIDANAKQDIAASSLSTPRNANTSSPSTIQLGGSKSSPQLPHLIQKNTTTTNNVIKNDIRLQHLEPWQEALFERQDRHEKALLQCQAKMDAIAKLFVAVSEQRDDYVKSLENQINGAQRYQPSAMQRPSPRGVNQDVLLEAPQLPPRPQDQPPPLPPQIQPNPQRRRITLATILQFPRVTYRYLTTTRLARLITLVKVEAERHPMPGGPNARFLDWNMIFKILFVCFVFGARMNNNGIYSGGGSGNNDVGGTFTEKLIRLWKMYRVHVFVMCALATYLLQTGLGQFLHRVFVRENIVRRVWRNQDLVEEGAGAVGDRPAALNNNGDNAQDNNELGDPLNLGNRQPGALRRGPLGGGAADGGGEIYRQFHRTFLAGAVARRHGAYDVPGNGGDGGEVEQGPMPNRNIHRIVDLVKDVVYLLGSVVLSLFPMWHPRVQVLPPQPFRHRAGVPENDGQHMNRRVLPNVRNNDAVVGNGNIAEADGGGSAGEDLPRDNGENNN